MDSKQALIADAKELGIDVDGRWSEEKIKALIDEKLESEYYESEAGVADIVDPIVSADADADADAGDEEIADPESEVSIETSAEDPDGLKFPFYEDKKQSSSAGVIKSIKNVSKVKQGVFHFALAPGERYELTDVNRNSKMEMKRLMRSIELGDIEVL